MSVQDQTPKSARKDVQPKPLLKLRVLLLSMIATVFFIAVISVNNLYQVGVNSSAVATSFQLTHPYLTWIPLTPANSKQR